MADTETPATPAAAEPEQPAANTSSGKPTIAVKVYAPFKVYYEGDAYSLSAENETGPFDVLPRHHNFLSMLIPCNLVLETPNGQQVVKINRALMHVKANRVVVFVDV